jgi:cell division protein FtsL
MNSDVLTKQFVQWVKAGWPGRISILIGFVLLSSIGVILASFETRALYSQLQVEEHVSDNLDSEYERLLLEQSAWAGYHRVDQLAREELQMRSPGQSNFVLMRRSPRLVSTAAAEGRQE